MTPAPESNNRLDLLKRAIADSTALFLLNQPLPALPPIVPWGPGDSSPDKPFSRLVPPPQEDPGTYAAVTELLLTVCFALRTTSKAFEEKEESKSELEGPIVLGKTPLSSLKEEEIRDYLRQLPSGFLEGPDEQVVSLSPSERESLLKTVTDAALFVLSNPKAETLPHPLVELAFEVAELELSEKELPISLLCAALHTLHAEIEQQMIVARWEGDDTGYKLLVAIEKEYANHFPLVDSGASLREGALVEQGEIGFSDKDPLGTWNLHECIALVVKNTRTGRIFLAHVDYDRDLERLDSAFKKLGTVGGDTLQVRLVGAKYDDMSGDSRQALASHTTLHRTLTELHQACLRCGVEGEILSAQVLEEHQPSAFIVEPESFSLTHAVIPSSSQDAILRRALLLLDEWDTELRDGPDLIEKQEKAPLILSAEAHARLQDLLVLPEGWLLSQRMQEEFFTDWPDEFSVRWKHEMREIRRALESAYADLFAESVPDSSFLELVRQFPIAVGDGAKRYNEVLRQCISDYLKG